jgi:hypothetical protein
MVYQVKIHKSYSSYHTSLMWYDSSTSMPQKKKQVTTSEVRTKSHIHRKTVKLRCQLWNKSSMEVDFTPPASQIHPTTINESQVLPLLSTPPLMYISVIKMLLHRTDQNCAVITGHLTNPIQNPTCCGNQHCFIHAA